MQRIVIVFLLLVAVAGIAPAQWQFAKVFPASDGLTVNDIHGLAVSPDGKVWVQRNGRNTRDSVLINDYLVKKTNGQDSILISRYDIVRALHVYNANGTEANFSPIFAVSINSKLDTLGGRRTRGTVAQNPARGLRYDASASAPVGAAKSGVGLRADHQGNILAMYGGDIYRINYQTGAGMAKVVAESLGTNNVADGLGGLVSPGVDLSGNIFVRRVFPGPPVKIYGSDLGFIANAIDTGRGFSRAITVSKDGADIYSAGYDLNVVQRYHSDIGVFGSYTLVDTLVKGFECESFDWSPKTGYLWASSGSYLNKPNQGDTVHPTHWTPAAWYAFNVANKQVKDSLIWTFGAANPSTDQNERPRGIAFSPGGDTAYVCVFGSTAYPGVRMYTKVTVGVDLVDNAVPQDYSLEQNYPNPFNPTTEIRYAVKTAGTVSLVVYDMLGKEIVLLVHEQKAAGTYSYRFDATGFPSGTYFYRMMVDGKLVASKKMLLLK